MAWVAVGSAVAGAAVSSTLNNRAAKQASSTPSTSRVELDPRMQGILYGNGNRVLRPGAEAQMGIGTRDDYARMLNQEHRDQFGIDIPTDQASQDWLQNAINDRMAQGQLVQTNQESDYITDEGVIGRITGLLDETQSPGMQSFGGAADNYLGYQGYQDMQGMRDAATRLQNSNVAAPQMQAASINPVASMTPAQMQAAGMTAAQMASARINAPEQNELGLAPAFGGMIYGDPGANPYLTGGIQRGINQSSNAFSDMLTDATRNITQSILPSIRSGAMVNGVMGGSRQGIAEARAVEDFSTQMGRAAQRFGQGNTDAAVTAQAGAYDADRSRALSAMSTLGGQQYGVATTQAGLEQDANRTNAGFVQDASRTNAGFAQDAFRTNAGFGQEAARTNYGGNLQTTMQDAQYRQQAGQSNLQSQLGTNELNAGNQRAGIGLNSSLLGQTYGFGSDADSYDVRRLGQVSGLLEPYTGLGAVRQSTTPMYSNTGSSLLGGAMMGQQLAQGFGFGSGNYNTWANNNSGVLSANPSLSYGDLNGIF